MVNRGGEGGEFVPVRKAEVTLVGAAEVRKAWHVAVGLEYGNGQRETVAITEGDAERLAEGVRESLEEIARRKGASPDNN